MTLFHFCSTGSWGKEILQSGTISPDFMAGASAIMITLAGLYFLENGHIFNPPCKGYILIR